MILEIACGNLESVRNAGLAGADRVELCAALPLGGITPSQSFISEALAISNIPVFVMIRPREGDFTYSAAEVEMMIQDSLAAKISGAHGIVTGALTANNTIDKDAVKRLMEAAYPLPVTFHRAFDLVKDFRQSAEELISAGVTRLLTSGGAQNAWEGRDVIKELQKNFGNKLHIMAGAGVNPENAAKLVEFSGVNEIHFSASVKKLSASLVKMGSADDGSYFVSDPGFISKIRNLFPNTK